MSGPQGGVAAVVPLDVSCKGSDDIYTVIIVYFPPREAREEVLTALSAFTELPLPTFLDALCLVPLSPSFGSPP